MAIEPLMERIRERKSVNVFRRVFEIRKNRTGFVQNPVIKKYRYRFIRNYLKLTLFYQISTRFNISLFTKCLPFILKKVNDFRKTVNLLFYKI